MPLQNYSRAKKISSTLSVDEYTALCFITHKSNSSYIFFSSSFSGIFYQNVSVDNCLSVFFGHIFLLCYQEKNRNRGLVKACIRYPRKSVGDNRNYYSAAKE